MTLIDILQEGETVTRWFTNLCHAPRLGISDQGVGKSWAFDSVSDKKYCLTLCSLQGSETPQTNTPSEAGFKWQTQGPSREEQVSCRAENTFPRTTTFPRGTADHCISALCCPLQE
jgi:hypothetical protein